MFRVLACVLLPVIVGCASQHHYVHAGASDSALRFDVIDVDPVVQRECAAAIERALRGRGPALALYAIPIDVEVTFWEDHQATSATRVLSTADLTATLNDRTAPTEVSAAGSGNDSRALDGVSTAFGRSRYAACEDGAERLALAIAELRAPRRSGSGGAAR